MTPETYIIIYMTEYIIKKKDIKRILKGRDKEFYKLEKVMFMIEN